MLDKEVLLPKRVFDKLHAWLMTGKVEFDSLKIDLQTINLLPLRFTWNVEEWTIQTPTALSKAYWKKGEVRFIAPLEAKGTVFNVSIKTTISVVKALNPTTVFVEIDNSPIDILLKPSV